MTYFWLGAEISDLLSLTAALQKSEESLQEQARALEERAVALRVILEQGRQERDELAKSIKANLESLVEPMLDRLARSLADRPESAYVEVIRQTLWDVAGLPGASQGLVSAAASPALTVREQEVLQLVRQGKTTSQIAQVLHLSASAVSFHRKNVRRKLGLTGRGQRLTSYLTHP